ncbi:DUF862-domain-containing protein [Coccomyxa subellipsoidea C-169]|uniref:DUF862-domain-containing protein n=1 Tax=Coccomyxa subellipsoidea (strain C-169) TaxID=574566 RepID=I0YVW7_COCSC|nr:DUF862-domain-containing protein [Coccomyxa subellipsoidea C-169]EIE22536.1 DUF862-domain-containing protein [Coccomyxa subellipsoidea C-169]|eukprot:XP_005647080.1 DUF862-domain-containing protein [Coccomyxa subellipsoidea C-169]
MADDEGQKVLLYVYDLSQGFAAQVSQAVLGKHIAGIWHTSVVVGGFEYFYGGGVQKALAGSTPYGHPVEIVNLGHTQIPQEVLNDYVNELSQVFTPQAYNLFTNNCNNFSNELATFLTGQPIPEHITSLPSEVLSTPMGRMLAPMLSGVESQLGNVQAGDSPLQLNSPIPGFMLPQLQQGTPAQTGPSASSSAAPAQPTPPIMTYPVAAPVKESAGASRAPAVEKQEAAGPSRGYSINDSDQAKAAQKAAFEAAVRAEFARIMAVGKNTANEAAALAVAAARQSLARGQM